MVPNKFPARLEVIREEQMQFDGAGLEFRYDVVERVLVHRYRARLHRVSIV